MRFKDLECLVRQWASDRGIYEESTTVDQYNKLREEFDELGEALDCDSQAAIVDAIGDMLVVLTNIAFMRGSSLPFCFHVAYSQIKDRKGKMVNGIFVKEEEIQRPNCSVCQDRGEISYYYDCSDHFAAGTAPGSEWRTKPCPKCKG